jgi:hypothetical protein
MPEYSPELRMEEFSRAYLAAICARAGLLADRVVPDTDGIDTSIRCRDVTKPRLGVQLKSTRVDAFDGDHINHDLDVRTYDLLRADRAEPAILAVVVLPVNWAEWLLHSEAELRLRRCGYFSNLHGMDPTTNEYTVRIHLPRTNLLTPSALRSLMGIAGLPEDEA